jgi:hypothetical protein
MIDESTPGDSRDVLYTSPAFLAGAHILLVYLTFKVRPAVFLFVEPHYDSTVTSLILNSMLSMSIRVFLLKFYLNVRCSTAHFSTSRL